MQLALAPDISTWPGDNPQPIGSRCAQCGATAFPVQPGCPVCSGDEMWQVLLPQRGTLEAWTTLGFPPGPPYTGASGQDFEPFGVGLVQLGDVIRVEGRLTESDPEKSQFAMEVDGGEIVTFAFNPVWERFAT